MNRLYRLPLSLLGLFLVLFTAGCGGGDGEGVNLDQVDAQIQQSHVSLVNAIESEDINSLALLLSPSYLNQGINRADFLDYYEGVFDDYSNIQMDIQINDIFYDNNNLPQVAQVYFEYETTGINRATGVRESIDGHDPTEEFVMYWRWEDGRWKMFGDQQNIATAQSLQQNAKRKALLGNPSPRKAGK